MVEATEDLETMLRTTNTDANPIATMVVTQRNGARQYQITYQAGLTEAYRAKLEQDYRAQAVMGAGDPTVLGEDHPFVQALEAQFNTATEQQQPPSSEVSEVSAQVAAEEVITDTLDMHFQHSTETGAAIGAVATLTPQDIQQIAAASPAAPQLLIQPDIQLQIVEQADNQPPIIAVSFEPITDATPQQVEEQLQKIEQQLTGMLENTPFSTNIPEIISQIKQQYPDLAQKNTDVEVVPPTQPEAHASIEGDVRRRIPEPVGSAQDAGQMMPSTALPYISAAQYQGTAAATQAQISASDVTAMTR
jgi:hypothetical protein